MATNPIRSLEQNSCLVEDYTRIISLELLSKYLQRDRKDNFFHFSHYKPRETLSCHSDKSTQAMITKNIIFVETNVTNIS